MTDNSVLQARARFWKVAGVSIAALFVLSTAGTNLNARHEETFVANDLGTLGGDRVTCPQCVSEAFAVNDKGRVVGRSMIKDEPADVFHAFVWSADTGMVDLGTLQKGTQSTASLISHNGVVAGFGFLDENNDAAHAFVRTHATGVVELALPGGCHSGPSAINAKGDVVGFSDSATNPTHAFLWTREHGIVDLGTLFPASATATSTANAISDNGIVVGQSTNKDNLPHAFMWTHHEGMVDLGTLPGGLNSTANGVNDDGVIVGTSDTATIGESHAFVWTRRTGMVDIGKDGFTSFGEQINGRFVIGQLSPTGSITKHGFAWTRKSGLFEIARPDGGFSRASAVNDAGVVVGNFSIGDIVRAFMWSASSGGPVVPLESDDGSSQANAINGDFIVGSSCEAGDAVCRARLWKPSSHSRHQQGDDDDQD